MDGQDRAPAPPPDHESASLMTQEPDAGGDDAGWKTEQVTVRAAENGGFIVTCSKVREGAKGGGPHSVSPGRDYQSKDYAFASPEQMLSYVASEFNAPSASAGAPAPAAPPAAVPIPMGGKAPAAPADDEGDAEL